MLMKKKVMMLAVALMAFQSAYSQDALVESKTSDNWFVGNVTGARDFDSVLKLNFLDPGRKYEATIYADAKNADYRTNPHAYVITKKKVDAKTVLKLHSVAGGGYAISIKPLN